jgi:hypothetical protein
MINFGFRVAGRAARVREVAAEVLALYFLV